MHADAHLASRRLGLRSIDELEHFGSTGASDRDGAHAANITPWHARGMRRGIFAIGLVLGCGVPEQPAPPSQAFVPAPTSRPVRPPKLAAPPVPPAPPPPAPLVIPTDCVKQGTVTAMEVRGATLIACIDLNSDGNADQCVEWNRLTGRVAKIESIDAVDSAPAVVTDDKPDTDTDDRVTQDTNAIDVCAEDRICVKLMPRLGDSATIDNVRADAAHHSVAVTISDGDSTNGRVEFWDVANGRLRTRVKLAGSDADASYTFAAQAYGDALVSIVTRSDNSLSTATLYGFDGRRRAALAGGSKYLQADQILQLAPGAIAVFDQGAPARPFNVYVHSTASGAVLARFTVQMTDDGQDAAFLMKIDRSTLGVVQWSNELRVDVLDSRSGGDKTLKAPRC
jgi:hypothetical protein